MEAAHRRPTPDPQSGVAKTHHGEWRRLALEFANQARHWGAIELVAFCQTLLASGDLSPRDPLAGHLRVQEGGTAVELPTSPWSESPEGSAALTVTLGAATHRVLEALRGMADTPQDDRFLHAALHAGRVQRVPHRLGGPTWEPHLSEGQSLSDWVLALFACDALEDRDPYDAHLAVCKECSFVTLTSPEEHPCASRRERSATSLPSDR